MAQVEKTQENARARAVIGLTVTSPAFFDGETIPERFTGDGDDVSPPLHWSPPPEGTKSLAVLCEDPDAPSGTFVHWLLWNLDADERGLQERITPHLEADQLVQGQNGFGRTGYAGPKPPRGEAHRYVFRVFALDHRPKIRCEATRVEFDRAIRGHVLAEGALIGRYARV
jgi:Raf kinase inhibitor-like YbhB/YbcL family protein